MPEVPDRFRRVGALDPTPLRAALEAHPALWREITLRQDYEGSAHKDTECIFLRAPASLTDILNVIETTAMPALEVLGIADCIATLQQLAGITEPARAMIVKLKPFGRITPHRDEGAYARATNRYHFVVSTCANCRFRVADEWRHLRAGELWWFNHQLEHEVHNGDADRIHLIIDGYG